MATPSRTPASPFRCGCVWMTTHAVELVAIILLIASARFALGVAAYQATQHAAAETQHETSP